ncbi:NADPH-dependent FMN reductase [Streptomyces sp. NPDC091377]|uniref:NADPH-dependent FMN reductase n=1 Tax=Streptomyces sp. NPDC091377 TaxID=3365995 RepID=UPI00381601C5
MHRVLQLSGSLRKDSLNSRLLSCLPALAPGLFEWRTFDGLGELPLYDEDADTDVPPPAVGRFRRAVAECDGLVIATPEYNHSLPGVLKNAIDWASRPKDAPALTGKGVVVLTATPARARGFRGVADTAAMLNELGNLVVPQPQAVVHLAHRALATDEYGGARLLDPEAARLIRVQLRVLGDLLAQDQPGALLRSIRTHLAGTSGTAPTGSASTPPVPSGPVPSGPVPASA